MKEDNPSSVYNMAVGHGKPSFEEITKSATREKSPNPSKLSKMQRFKRELQDPTNWLLAISLAMLAVLTLLFSTAWRVG